SSCCVFESCVVTVDKNEGCTTLRCFDSVSQFIPEICLTLQRDLEKNHMLFGVLFKFQFPHPRTLQASKPVVMRNTHLACAQVQIPVEAALRAICARRVIFIPMKVTICRIKDSYNAAQLPSGSFVFRDRSVNYVPRRLGHLLK